MTQLLPFGNNKTQIKLDHRTDSNQDKNRSLKKVC